MLCELLHIQGGRTYLSVCGFKCNLFSDSVEEVPVEDYELPLSSAEVLEAGECGEVWCSVVWCGVVWCSVMWCGVVWCGVVCSVL